MSPCAVLAAAALIAVVLPLRAQTTPSTPLAQTPPAPTTSQPTTPPLPAPGQTDAENAPDDAQLPIPPVPPRIAEGDQYDHCMDMLADDPAGADALATSWKTGGEAAAHCHALAQVELGNPAAGAALLTTLASTSQAPAPSRAEVFGQAAQAWTMAGASQDAYAAATQAINLAPEDPDLRVTHAIAAITVHRDAEAEEDLTDALEADPKRVDALILRATARRDLGHLAAATADINAACAQDPDNADALLERGIIRQRQGDLAGARADWEKAADMSPDTATGELAQQNLALLDASARSSGTKPWAHLRTADRS
jgi:tetratricopeptide (TPR) repeat protein